MSLPVPDWCSLSLPLSFSLTLTHALSLTHTYITDSALTREVQERLTLSHRLFSPRSTLPLPSALHLPLPTATHLSADCDSSPFFNQTPTVTNSTTPIHLPIRSVTKPPPPLPHRTSALPLSSVPLQSHSLSHPPVVAIAASLPIVAPPVRFLSPRRRSLGVRRAILLPVSDGFRHQVFKHCSNTSPAVLTPAVLTPLLPVQTPPLTRDFCSNVRCQTLHWAISPKIHPRTNYNSLTARLEHSRWLS